VSGLRRPGVTAADDGAAPSPRLERRSPAAPAGSARPRTLPPQCARRTVSRRSLAAASRNCVLGRALESSVRGQAGKIWPAPRSRIRRATSPSTGPPSSAQPSRPSGESNLTLPDTSLRRGALSPPPPGPGTGTGTEAEAEAYYFRLDDDDDDDDDDDAVSGRELRDRSEPPHTHALDTDTDTLRSRSPPPPPPPPPRRRPRPRPEHPSRAVAWRVPGRRILARFFFSLWRVDVLAVRGEGGARKPGRRTSEATGSRKADERVSGPRTPEHQEET
jgi:hypothetical protein